MSGPVDVLAAMDLSPENARVLRECARDTGAFRVTKQGATDLAAACAAALKAAEARAAVAELIEAADGVDATHGPMLNPRAVTPKQRQAALNRLRAALARVGGAK